MEDFIQGYCNILEWPELSLSSTLLETEDWRVLKARKGDHGTSLFDN